MCLPESLRIKSSDVWVTRNEVTGEITLQPKPRPDELEAFFTLLDATPKGTDAFIPPRDDAPAAADPLADWKVNRGSLGRRKIPGRK